MAPLVLQNHSWTRKSNAGFASIAFNKLFSLSSTAAVTLFLSFSAALYPESQDVLVSSHDPCAEIAGLKWVSPSDARACFTSFPIDLAEKTNIIDVVTKTLAFHTSTNYQIKAPEPFTQDVHEDILRDLSVINSTAYISDFHLHIDISRALKRLYDGHAVYVNLCYDSLYLTYLPIPLTYLTGDDGIQHIHIAPEAFIVAKVEFADQLDYWQNALPGHLKGNLESLSGARVLEINGADPSSSVNANAYITGGYQSLGTRQNSFFSSYQRASLTWNYVMGNFAQQSLPIYDEVSLTVLRVNSSTPDKFTIPYRSRISPSVANWTDAESFRANNCVATAGTNGVDLYDPSSASTFTPDQDKPITIFQQQPKLSEPDARKHRVNVHIDSMPPSNVVLPPELQPPVPAVNGSSQVSQFYMLNDNITGVLALGSFSSNSFSGFQTSLLDGLTNLTKLGATQLVVDVTNNGGGFICVAHWLHRIISGPRNSTEPNAGLYTQTRAGPLAQLIVKQIVAGEDPDDLLMYNPLNFKFGNNTDFPAKYDWLEDPVKKVINGHDDAFSQKLGQECQPFDLVPPTQALFDPKKVAIVGNGRCASSCSLFSITMAKEDGAKTVVVGGRQDVQQQYCGVVGGQSTGFSTIDTEIKSAKLKRHALAPPDFLTNSIQGITWRLGFGIDDPTQPEEWQNHPADFNMPLTVKNVNNPFAIWEDVVTTVFT